MASKSLRKLCHLGIACISNFLHSSTSKSRIVDPCSSDHICFTIEYFESYHKTSLLLSHQAQQSYFLCYVWWNNQLDFRFNHIKCVICHSFFFESHLCPITNNRIEYNVVFYALHCHREPSPILNKKKHLITFYITFHLIQANYKLH